MPTTFGARRAYDPHLIWRWIGATQPISVIEPLYIRFMMLLLKMERWRWP